MSNKKPKTNVDTDYNRQIKQFSDEQKELPLILKKIRTMEDKLDFYNHHTMTEKEKDEYYILKSKIKELTDKVKEMTSLEQVTEFYLKTAPILNEYYGTQSTPSAVPLTPSGVQPNVLASNKASGNLLDFFGNNKKSENTNKSTQRGELYQQYLLCTDPHHVEEPQYDNSDSYCNNCGEYRELMTNESVWICPKCGEEVPTIVESDKPSYNDPPHENMYFAYKRINHFREQLAHFQAKETTKIPQEIYDVIQMELKKDKHINLATLTRSQVKKYLQKYSHLGYNKYYENINQIIRHLNGIQPFQMKPEVEEQLCSMFMKIQEPFERHCPPDRTNFLSYSYVMYKFCQLLGYNEYLPCFTLLKSRDKLRQQDKIWKNICNDLHWPVYPSYT